MANGKREVRSGKFYPIGEAARKEEPEGAKPRASHRRPRRCHPNGEREAGSSEVGSSTRSVKPRGRKSWRARSRRRRIVAGRWLGAAVGRLSDL
jgi:hypothetical protein